MGCINSDQNFKHWFGSIHFSGPCNRSCYFCIGQHMMGLDKYNNLDLYPLKGLSHFAQECLDRKIFEVNLTGTNTDPLLYKHLGILKKYLKSSIPDLIFGVRTNGVMAANSPDWGLFDKGSISFPTFDPETYKKMMGSGSPPRMQQIFDRSKHMDLKVNICLSEINAGDLPETIRGLSDIGFRRINVRELYGQPNYGNPFAHLEPTATTLGMNTYKVFEAEVTYWDVHFVEVESVNLYANGTTSITYPITKGYDAELGLVKPQAEFREIGRVNEQWVSNEPA